MLAVFRRKKYGAAFVRLYNTLCRPRLRKAYPFKHSDRLNVFFTDQNNSKAAEKTVAQKLIYCRNNFIAAVFVNILIAAVLFKLTLKIIAPGNVYNLETEPLSNLPLKFFTVIKIAFGQLHLFFE